MKKDRRFWTFGLVRALADASEEKSGVTEPPRKVLGSSPRNVLRTMAHV